MAKIIIRQLCPCCLGIALAVDRETWDKIDEMQKGEAPPEAGSCYQFSGQIPGLVTSDGNEDVYFQGTAMQNFRGWEIANGFEHVPVCTDFGKDKKT